MGVTAAPVQGAVDRPARPRRCTVRARRAVREGLLHAPRHALGQHGVGRGQRQERRSRHAVVAVGRVLMTTVRRRSAAGARRRPSARSTASSSSVCRGSSSRRPAGRHRPDPPAARPGPPTGPGSRGSPPRGTGAAPARRPPSPPPGRRTRRARTPSTSRGRVRGGPAEVGMGRSRRRMSAGGSVTDLRRAPGSMCSSSVISTTLRPWPHQRHTTSSTWRESTSSSSTHQVAADREVMEGLGPLRRR